MGTYPCPSPRLLRGAYGHWGPVSGSRNKFSSIIIIVIIIMLIHLFTAGHKEAIPVRSIVGDVRKLTELRLATRDVTAVIHTAGVVSFGTFPDVKAMNDVNAKGAFTLSEFLSVQSSPFDDEGFCNVNWA